MEKINKLIIDLGLYFNPMCFILNEEKERICLFKHEFTQWRVIDDRYFKQRDIGSISF